MMKTHIDKEKTLPLWAAIGAPFVGVPLLVALLALVTPADDSAGMRGGDARVEPTEAHAAVVQFDTGCEAADLHEG